MDNIYLKIEGRADESLIKSYDVNNIFGSVKKDKSVVILVADYSEFDIPLGQVFNFVEAPNKSIIAIQSRLIIISIFQKEIAVLSSGHKALVAIKFFDNIDFRIFPKIKEHGSHPQLIYISSQLMD